MMESCKQIGHWRRMSSAPTSAQSLSRLYCAGERGINRIVPMWVLHSRRPAKICDRRSATRLPRKSQLEENNASRRCEAWLGLDDWPVKCLTNRTVNPFPVPAASHPPCRFPAVGFSVCFATRFMGRVVLDEAAEIHLSLVRAQTLAVPLRSFSLLPPPG